MYGLNTFNYGILHNDNLKIFYDDSMSKLNHIFIA